MVGNKLNFSSGKSTTRKREKFFVISLFNLSAILSLIFFGIKNFLNDNYTYVSIISLFLIATSIHLLIFLKKKNYESASWITVILMALLLLVLFIFLPSQGYSILWIYLFPILNFMLLGNKKGIFLTSLLPFIFIVIYAFFPSILKYKYDFEYFLRLIFIYIVSAFLIFVYETSKTVAEKRIKKLLENLEEKNQELKSYEEELTQQNNQLKILASSLKDKEEKLSKILENLGEGIIILDKNENFVFQNKAALQIFETDNLIGKNAFSFIDEIEKQKILENNQLRQKGEKSTYELEITSEKGKKKTILVTGVPLFDDNKNFIGSLAVIRDITKEKIIQERLRKEHQFITNLLRNLNEGIIICDFNHIINYVNKKAAKILDDYSGNILGKNIKKWIPTIEEKIKQLKEQKVISAAALKAQTSKNKEIHILASFSLNYNLHNEPEGYILVFSDVTNYMKLQYELEIKIKHLEILMNNLPFAIFFKDKNLKYLLVNHNYAKLNNINIKEILGKRFTDLFPDEKHVEELDLQVIKTRKPVLNLVKKIEDKWLSISKIPLISSKGEVEGIVGIIQDITEEKNREEEILMLNRQLRIFYVALIQSPLGFVMLDKEFRITFVNKQFLINMGYDEEWEVLGKTPYELAYEKTKKIALQGYRTLKSGKTWTAEYINQKKDGTLFYERSITSPIYDLNGELLGYVVYHQDITEEKEKEKLLKEQYEQLQIAQKQIQDSINYAKEIQNNILIQDQQFLKYFSEQFTIYLPRDVISGDFYYFNVAHNFKIFAVADCTGHGIPGAFLSILGINLLHEIVTYRMASNPAEALNLLRIKFKEILKEYSGGMDISLCAINEENLLTFSGANHHIILIQNGEFKFIKGTKSPIGRHPVERDFELHTFSLQKGDIIYLFSDGYIDQLGFNKEKQQVERFSRRRFLELIKSISHLPLASQKQILLDKLEQWKKNLQQTDDITILALKL